MYVKSIKLDSVKGFSDVTFDFERPGGAFAGWTVLVGGNASGKSTVLKAIALAVIGPDVGRQLIGSPSGWIAAGRNKGEALTQIRWDKAYDAFRTGGQAPGLLFDAGVRWLVPSTEAKKEGADASLIPEFRAVEQRNAKQTRIKTPDRGPWNPNARGWFAAGYGPMRRLSGSSTESIRFSVGAGSVSRFVTLFREDAALSESEAWLRLIHSRQIESKDLELAKLLEGVRTLLGDGLLPHGMKISRVTVDHVYIVDGHGVELPMRDVSDGCRSMYATVLDIIHSLAEVYGVDGLFTTNASGNVTINKPGVVLIDEIDAHLHPKWQHDIPEWLKIHFPLIQFIVSTHSALVAQAADENGIFVLPSQDDVGRTPRRLDQHEYEKIKLRRAEKTLLGSAFGLDTTRSKWANDRIEEWKMLQAKSKAGVELSQAEKANLDDLRGQMEIAYEGDITASPSVAEEV